MECRDAITGRRSCRNFTDRAVEKEKLTAILEAALMAPSPANKQPWEFLVAADPKYNARLKETSEKTKHKLAARSGWKWLPTFNIDFLIQAPVLIVVLGDPSRSGAEQFLDEPSPGYLEACSAAIQNMLLAAHDQGLATLWFSLYEKSDVREIFAVDDDKDPVAVICVGYSEHPAATPARKTLDEKVKFL